MRKTVILTILLAIAMAHTAWGEDLRLDASLERTVVSPGNPLYLNVTFYGSQDAPKPDIEPIDGLQIRYVGPSTKVSVVNGKVSKSISHAYLIIPLSGGTYKIGPFSVYYNGERFIAPPVSLQVNDKPSGGTATASGGGSAGYTGYQAPVQRQASPAVGYQSDRIFIVMDVDKTTMYVNEKVDVTIRLFANNMEVKDIEFPAYKHDGFTSGEFAQPERTTDYIRGVRYEGLIFRQTIYGIKEGVYTLGPAKVSCKIVAANEASRRSSFFGMDDFFSSRFGSRVYPVELASDDIQVKVLPFPKEARPDDFKGAVGDFSLEVFPESKSVKVGDPVVLRSVIKGSGNLDTVTSPDVNETADIKTYEPQVSVKGATKVYEQILIPTSEAVKEIPPVSFSFFNPRTRKYETITKGPFPIAVTPRPAGEKQATMVSFGAGGADVYAQKEEIGEDIVHIKADSGVLRRTDKYAFNEKYFWALQSLPVILFAFLYASDRKRQRVMRDKGYARLLKAPRKARKGLDRAKRFLDKKDSKAFYDELFKTLQYYLGDRFNLSKGNVNYQVVEDKLVSRGVDPEVISKLKEAFEKCNMIRYAPSAGEGDPGELLGTVREVIDHLEKRRV